LLQFIQHLKFVFHSLLICTPVKMKFNSRGGVSILELFIYFPSLIVAFIICSRHGFNRSSGWIFTLVLCLIRIVGACCQLATYHDQSSGLLETTFILDSVGISPLLLATLGLLSRCVDAVNTNTTNAFHMLQFRLTQLVIVLGLILSIVGGTNSVSANGTFTVQTTSKIGVLLYVVGYVVLAVRTVTIIPKLSSHAGEKHLALAVIIALPFILVRIIYSLLAVFLHNHDFSLINGSVAILVVMSVLEEFLVVIIYLIVGWRAEALPATKRGPLTSRQWKGPLQPAQSDSTTQAGKGYDGGGQRFAGRSGGKRQGPIHTLVGMAVAAAGERAQGTDVESGVH
jgi:hypothetical protein